MTTTNVPHNNISMISVSQSYIVTQKVHIEGATNSTLFNLNSATKIGYNKTNQSNNNNKK